MNVLLTIMFLLQAVGTPIADGSLIVSNKTVEFPALPEGSEPMPINDDWELLYYEVNTGSSEYVIQGEIRNISPNPLSTPTLIVTVAGGLQVGIHPDVDQVGSGERAPFRQSNYEEDITVALNQSEEIKFTGVCEFYEVVPKQEFEWEFQDVEIEYNAERSAVRISGNVTNIGDASAERNAPMLFGFTADGRYVGSIYPLDAPSTIFSGDQYDFEMDHGFDSYHSNLPFAGAGRDAIFVLAVSTPVFASLNCVG